MKIFGGILCIALIISPAVWAQIGDNPNEISVYASICERIINGESKSSARVRASDKASFKAVEEIPELSGYRDALDTHHFNLKVYRLVDNYLEDIKISTVSQDNGQVCVEVTAYLPSPAIEEVFNEQPLNEEQPLDTDENMILELEEEDIPDAVSISIPPKPAITINKEIAYDDVQSSSVIKTSAAATAAEPAKKDDDEETRVFIDRTDFYNGESTAGFFAPLEEVLVGKPGIKAVAAMNNPDYILKTRVLKARVDNVNSETSRLQIVVALDLTDTATSETITEHQNRFILFNSSEDAQKTAADLTRKLLVSGTSKLLPKIKTSVVNDNRGLIITPH